MPEEQTRQSVRLNQTLKDHYWCPKTLLRAANTSYVILTMKFITVKGLPAFMGIDINITYAQSVSWTSKLHRFCE
jgi:hypothetical protein